MTAAAKLQRLRIAKLPDTPLLASDTFELVEDAMPVPAEGEAVLRMVYHSVDAGTRESLSPDSDYVVKRKVGEAPFGSSAVGEVIASRHADFPVGSLAVTSLSDYQSHVLVRPGTTRGLRRIEHGLPLSAHAGILGLTGFTAWCGVFRAFPLRPGECFVVSAAAGAVGAAAGQFARIAGARTVGIAGGPEKCDFLVRELGFDAAVDYRKDLAAGLASACPEGIDFFFDNVGGEVLRSAFAHMNPLGRIAISGQLAQYGNSSAAAGPNMMTAVLKRLSIRGFLSVQDWPELMPRFLDEVSTWLRDGRIANPVTIVEGLANAHEAINNLMTGRNIGKQLLQVGPEPVPVEQTE